MAVPPMNLVPMTELDAVNMMLLSIVQAPVSTLAVTGLKDVSFAQYILHQVSREVQLRGWDFNSDDEYTLSKDVNGKIDIPTNALRVDPVDTSKRFVQRDDSGSMRFWDKDEHTFVIDADVDVNIVWFFDYETLPEAARAYIAYRAARVFQTNQVGSQILYQFTKEREQELLVELEREELDTVDGNFLTGDYNTAWIGTRQFGYRNRNF